MKNIAILKSEVYPAPLVTSALRQTIKKRQIDHFYLIVDNCQLHQAKRQIYYPKGGDARLNMVLQQQCHNTVNFTVQVNFICNPSALLDTLDENPAENNCSITFNIQTALTCPPLENLTYPKVVISEASSETKTEQTSLRSVLPSKTIKTMKPERSYTHSNCCVAGYSNKTATFCLKQIIPLKV